MNRSYESDGAWRNSGVDEVAVIAAARADPTRWTIALGANDAYAVSSPQQADALVASLIDRFDQSDEVIWLTVRNDLFPHGAELINDAIRRSRAVVADWAAIVEPGDLYDGVHTSPVGTAKLAALYCQILGRR